LSTVEDAREAATEHRSGAGSRSRRIGVSATVAFWSERRSYAAVALWLWK
jgi:hypothetical protein